MKYFQTPAYKLHFMPVNELTAFATNKEGTLSETRPRANAPVALSLASFREDCAMLVLSRKLNEEIVIAGNVRVKVLEINGSSIRLGIEAPAQVPVLRSELELRGNQSVHATRHSFDRQLVAAK